MKKKEIIMHDIDLGLATDWEEGDTHGRVCLRKNQKYPNSTISQEWYFTHVART